MTARSTAETPLVGADTEVPQAPREAGGETAGEGGRRRRRRGGRGRGEGRGEGAPAETLGDDQPTAAEADAESIAAGEAEAEALPTTAAEAGDAPREGGRRRSRGRGRRERSEDRGEDTAAEADATAVDAVEAGAGPVAVDAVETAAWADTQPGETSRSAPVAEAAAVDVAAPAPVVAAPEAAAPAAVAVAAPAPVDVPFHLPTQDLQALASGAGLEWVESDADKVRAVQAAMAAEPKPIHVPREIKPVVILDEGPLVLVETKKDLSQMKLPFEHGGSPAAGA
jgi:ribonuclease E